MIRKRMVNGGNVRLRHRFTLVVQGLFCGVEWKLLKDGKVFASGESPSISSGVTAARAVVFNELRNEKGAI